MIIAGIDPGSKESGLVLWGMPERKSHFSMMLTNYDLLKFLRMELAAAAALPHIDILGIEQIRGYGITAGDDTFDTCEWSGRFREAFENRGGKVIMQPRKEVKLALCGNTTTNSKYIRMALIDRYGDTGTKKTPGPLYGISGHLWSALAVAVTIVY
jgi:hypothetical protein